MPLVIDYMRIFTQSNVYKKIDNNSTENPKIKVTILDIFKKFMKILPKLYPWTNKVTERTYTRSYKKVPGLKLKTEIISISLPSPTK